MLNLIKYNFYQILKVKNLKVIMILISGLFVIVFNYNYFYKKINFDKVLKSLGFELTEVNITGIYSLNKSDIKDHIIYKNCTNLFCLDLVSTKKSLEKLNWVKQAKIKLILPSQISIKIIEEKARFLLDTGSHLYLLNSSGKKITVFNSKKTSEKKLISISGENVINKISELNTILAASPELARNITGAKLISNRRWTLIYSYLTSLDLPEIKPDVAFKKLNLINNKYGLISDSLKKIDLRVKDRMIIKLNINDFQFKESKI